MISVGKKFTICIVGDSQSCETATVKGIKGDLCKLVTESGATYFMKGSVSFYTIYKDAACTEEANRFLQPHKD